MIRVTLKIPNQMKAMKRESDNTEATEESGFLYDEKGRKIDIRQFYEAIRKRKKRTAKGDDEIPFKSS